MNKYYIGILFFLLLPLSVFAGESAVKSSTSDTVYYVDEENTRHAFPNRLTYESWFGDDFSQVSVIDDSQLSTFPLGANVTIRPGRYLVKVPSSPEVYAVEPGGMLRHVTSADVAKKIFGSNWRSKIRDIPEAFFENYTIGAPIDFIHQVPDGWVVQLVDDRYYWKQNNILEPFESWSDVLANGYNRQDVLSADIDLFKKRKPIVGRSDRVFNISLEKNTLNATCQTDALRAAVIFVTRDEEVSAQEKSILQTTVNQLGASWFGATDELSSLVVDAQVTVITDTDSFLVTTNNDKKTVLDLHETALQFYETAADEYDFLIIYNDFLEPEQYKEKASYHAVRNDFLGTNQILLDRSRFYGSRGRLKGIVQMNKINQYSVASTDGVVSLLNLIHHELLHHWAAFISFDRNGERDWSLLSEDEAHWSRWAGWISPLGGWGYEAIDNGLFRARRASVRTDEIISFAPIDLYLMGLIPARYMPAMTYVIPEDKDSVSDTVAGTLSSISVEDLHAAHGPATCVIRQ